jgi:hypothetical protein
MMLPRADTETWIAEEILRQVAARGSDKSICPSEVARALRPGDAPGWQSLMTPVREVAVGLARAGQIDILRKGRPVAPPDDASALKGVIRLRHRSSPSST